MQTRPARNKRPCKANYNAAKRWLTNKARRVARPQDSGVSTFAQCVEIQKRRVKAKKRGIAKAVRRSVMRGADDENHYREMIQKLPVLWAAKPAPPEPVKEVTLQDQIRQAMGVEL